MMSRDVQTPASSDDTILHLILCPACGSDPLIPLTFTSAQNEDKIDLPRRPVAKCLACGERTYVSAKAPRALSQD